jgi:hypothetical protein
MREEIIRLANELTDLAEHYEEKTTNKTWRTGKWKEIVQRVREFGLLSLDDDCEPADVLESLLEVAIQKEQILKEFGLNRFVRAGDAVLPQVWERRTPNNFDADIHFQPFPQIQVGRLNLEET